MKKLGTFFLIVLAVLILAIGISQVREAKAASFMLQNAAIYVFQFDDEETEDIEEEEAVEDEYDVEEDEFLEDENEVEDVEEEEVSEADMFYGFETEEEEVTEYEDETEIEEVATEEDAEEFEVTEEVAEEETTVAANEVKEENQEEKKMPLRDTEMESSADFPSPLTVEEKRILRKDKTKGKRKLTPEEIKALKYEKIIENREENYEDQEAYEKLEPSLKDLILNRGK